MSTGNVMGKLITPTFTTAPGIWNLRENQLAVQAGTWPGITAADSTPNRNILTMKAAGVANATTTSFRDGSTNNFTVTRAGDVTQGTFSPYFPSGYWSGYFDGTGDYLTIPNSTALQMGTGDFTMELWWFTSSIAGYQTLFDKGYNGGGDMVWQTGSGDGRINVYTSGGALMTSSTAVAVNTWNHIALVRNGSAMTLYQNGAVVASATNSTNFNNTAAVGIGGGAAGNYPVAAGYISNFRIVKGSVVYTAAFTPPTAPLAAITNTSLLCLQDSRFKDNSTNNFTITKVGDAAVTRFSPFTPPPITTSGTYGSSAYFDGTGDYLAVTASASLQLGTGNFTIEGWINPSALTAFGYIFASTASSGTAGNIRMTLGNSTLYPIVVIGGSIVITSSIAFPVNSWTHFSLTRSASTLTLYVNGVSAGTATDSTSLISDTFLIGQVDGAYYYNGYLSNFRVVKGVAVYTAGFTPPTAPVTAITNTSLLVDFDNAGIYDSIGRSDLRTLGTAKVSTSTTKWGAASIALDGTANCCVKAIPTSDQPYSFGTGDFTIELWFNLTSLGTTPAFYDWRPASTSTPSPCVMVSYVTAGKLTYYMGTASAITGTTTVTTGTWYHLAVCRSSGTTRMFLNGVQEGSNYADTNNYTGTNPTFGALGYDTSLTAFTVNGFLEDIRVSRVARYTAAFTPPTAPFA